MSPPVFAVSVMSVPDAAQDAAAARQECLFPWQKCPGSASCGPVLRSGSLIFLPERQAPAAAAFVSQFVRWRKGADMLFRCSVLESACVLDFNSVEEGPALCRKDRALSASCPLLPSPILSHIKEMPLCPAILPRLNVILILQHLCATSGAAVPPKNSCLFSSPTPTATVCSRLHAALVRREPSALPWAVQVKDRLCARPGSSRTFCRSCRPYARRRGAGGAR